MKIAKLKILTRSLHYFIFIIMIIGCTPEYIPNTVNVPILQKEGEFQASLNVGGFVFFDPQFAYAVTDNVGLMLNTSFQNTKGSRGDYHKHILGEMGIGYFHKLGKYMNFEIYSGYGYNKIKTKRTAVIFGEDNTFYSNTNTDRIFLQPNIGFVTDFMEYSFSSRFTYNFIHDLYRKEENQASFFEPAITLKYVRRPLKISIQAGISYPLYFQDDVSIEFKPYIIALGVHYFIDTKK